LDAMPVALHRHGLDFTTIDREILQSGLVKRDESGRYAVAPLKEFEGL
jgi:hypothetical protein